MGQGREACLIYSAAVDENEVEVIATPILIHSITLFNPHATVEAYLQLFNLLAANVTVGTTANTFAIGVESQVGNTQIHCVYPKAIPFDKGLTIAVTSGRGTNGAADMEVLITYNNG